MVYENLKNLYFKLKGNYPCNEINSLMIECLKNINDEGFAEVLVKFINKKDLIYEFSPSEILDEVIDNISNCNNDDLGSLLSLNYLAICNPSWRHSIFNFFTKVLRKEVRCGKS